MSLKEEIIEFWNKKPCGTNKNIPEIPNANYFQRIRTNRYRKEPFIFKFAQFDQWQNKRVLEIGCGIGIDGMEFMKNKADYYGIDITPNAIKLARAYFTLNNFNNNGIYYYAL